MLAELVERHSTDARRLHLREVVADYQRTIQQELDLLHEAHNTARLRANFAGSPLLYVPRVYWDLTRVTCSCSNGSTEFPLGTWPRCGHVGPI